MNRWQRSWVVARESWAVLRNNPSLSIFPILSAIAVAIVSAPFVVALAASSGLQAAITEQRQNYQFAFTYYHYALTFGMYLADYFVIVFFNSALVACAHASLSGKPTSVAFGIQAATRRIPQILGWALLAATVGTILKAIEERAGVVGTIVTAIIGLAWNVAVFFVVPLLVLEGLSPVTALKQSATMIRQSWGERLIVGIGIGFAYALLIVIGFIPIVGCAVFFSNHMIVLGALAVVAAVVYWIVLSIVMSALSVIFQTALYMYCRTGQVPEAYSQMSVEGAFRQRGGSRLFGR